jgi:ankyrin repeat protein
LHWCARKGHYLALKYLLKGGADVNSLNSRHQTPLILACDTRRSSNVNVVNIILKQPNVKLNIRDVGGSTALMCAIFKTNVWITRSLLMAGCQVSEVSPDIPSPYEISQWILATSLYLEVNELSIDYLYPEGLFYSFCSLKGAYRSKLAVWIQSLLSYDTELVFRMVQRRKIEEDSESQIKNRQKSINFTEVKQINIDQLQSIDLATRDHNLR